MPPITTSTQLQRNYKKIRKQVKELKVPIVVLRGSKPDFVLVDYQTFEKKFYR